MPFRKTDEKLLHQCIFVVPIAGYGWHRLNEDGSHDNIEPLDRFQIELLEFFYVGNKPTVVCGKIVKDHLSLAGWWVSLVPVFDGVNIALDKEAGACGTLISQQKPLFDPLVTPVNHASVVSTKSRPHYSGISMASLFLDLISKKITLKTS